MRKLKFPIMSVKKHESEMELARQNYLVRERALEAQLDIDKRDLREVIAGLHEVRLVRDFERDRWRIVLDLDVGAMCMALERGNDERMIDYIVEAFAHNVRRELSRMNIQRPADVGLGRRGASWRRV